MATNRRVISRARRGWLSPDAELELWLGPPGPGREPFFANAEEARTAWERVREHFPLPTSPGRRPWAWWCFEQHGLNYPGCDRERSTLYAAGGILDTEEKAELLIEWRREFDRAQKRGFAHCLGSGGWLHGADARRAHYAWTDIPFALVKQWTAEHRRHKQTIRDLAAMAAPSP
jgi:hypothetical protein